MNQFACYILTLFSFFIPISLPANEAIENDLSIYKKRDYFVNKAKLLLAKSSHRQLQALSKQTQLFHLKEWKKDRLEIVQYLSRKDRPTLADFQNYTNAKYEGQ